jgi:hypothetical protein
MQEAVLAPLAPWQNLSVLIGTAAATLTGLIFVVATLIAGVRVRVSSPNEAFATFNTPNVMHFCLALLVARCSAHPGRRSGLLPCCWASRVSGGDYFCSVCGSLSSWSGSCNKSRF